MRLITVVLILSLVSLSVAMMGPSTNWVKKGKWGGGGRSDGRRRCQRLPRPMSLQQFQDEVQGEGYTHMMSTLSYEIDVNRLLLHANAAIYETDTQGEFRSIVTGRVPGDTGSGVCPFVVQNFITAKSQDFAWFDAAALNVEVYYFTRNASNYLVEVTCNETRGDNPGRQCCTGDWLVNLFTNHDPPHFFDWKGVSRDLWRQMKLCLNDNYVFAYQLNACENAIP